MFEKPKLGADEEKISCQGVFFWVGQQYKRLRKIGYRKFTRDRKIFFALNVPGVSEMTDKQLADWMIMDIVLDEGIEIPYIITDPQKVVGGFMSPATEQEYTDNPGNVVWIGWVPIPKSARFSEPGMHNITIKAAFKDRDQPESERLFDDAHCAVVVRYEFEIIDDAGEGPESPESFAKPRPGM